MELEHVITVVGQAVEVAGIAVLVIGILIASARFVVKMTAEKAYERYRHDLGKALLLGLELLVAGDIIRTVTSKPDLNSALVLLLIVVIRIFLSWSIQLEVEGRWPWQR